MFVAKCLRANTACELLGRLQTASAFMFHLGVQLAGEDVRVIEQVGHVCYENFR